MIEIILGIILACLIADFVSGFSHMLEDSYGNPEWEFSKSKVKLLLYKYIVKDNILHHKKPAAFLSGSFLSRNYTTIIPSLGMATISYLLLPTFWPLWTGFLIMTLANQVHCWSHSKANWFVRFLQKCYILQSPKQHKIHHSRPYETSYMVIFPWFNPIFNHINLWGGIKFIIWLITGVKPLETRKND